MMLCQLECTLHILAAIVVQVDLGALAAAFRRGHQVTSGKNERERPDYLFILLTKSMHN
jgi:hypothetical protein